MGRVCVCVCGVWMRPARAADPQRPCVSTPHTHTPPPLHHPPTHPHTHGRSEVSGKPASRRGCCATSTSPRPAVPSLSGRGAVDPPRTGPRTTGRLRLRSHNNRGVRLACVRPRCARVDGCVGGWVVGEGAPPSRSPVVVGAQRGGSAAHWSKDSLRPCVCLWGWCVEAGAS